MTITLMWLSLAWVQSPSAFQAVEAQHRNAIVTIKIPGRNGMGQGLAWPSADPGSLLIVAPKHLVKDQARLFISFPNNRSIDVDTKKEKTLHHRSLDLSIVCIDKGSLDLGDFQASPPLYLPEIKAKGIFNGLLLSAKATSDSFEVEGIPVSGHVQENQKDFYIKATRLMPSDSGGIITFSGNIVGMLSQIDQSLRRAYIVKISDIIQFLGDEFPDLVFLKDSSQETREATRHYLYNHLEITESPSKSDSGLVGYICFRNETEFFKIQKLERGRDGYYARFKKNDLEEGMFEYYVYFQSLKYFEHLYGFETKKIKIIQSRPR